MYTRFNTALLYVVVVSAIMAITLPVQKLSAGQTVEVPTAANFALAEKFSDSAVYEALFGPFEATGKHAIPSEQSGWYVRFNRFLVVPKWIDGTSNFWFAVRKNGVHQYFLVNSESGTRETLFDPDALSRSIAQKTGEVIELSERIPDTLSVTEGGDLIKLKINEKVIQFRRSTGAINKKEDVQNPIDEFVPPTHEFSRSPDGSYIVFAVENNLYVRDRDGEEYQLTDDGEMWCGYSQQFGSDDSQKPLQQHMAWIGDSHKFFVVRWDNRQVGEMWVIDSVSEPRPTLHTTRFAMPGERHVPIPELWIFDAEKRTGFRVETNKWPGQFIGDMDIGTRGFLPSKDGRHIYFTRMSRGFHEVELLRVDVRTGSVQVLLSEKSDPYFTIRFPQFAPLKDGGEILWLSDRSGRNHYYIFDDSGTQKSVVTNGDYTVERIAYLDESNRFMVAGVFGKDPEAYPFHRQYYRFPLDGGEPLQLTPEDALHSAYFSPDGRFFVDNYSRADKALTAVLRNTSGDLVMQLEQQDEGRLLSMGFKMPEYFTVKAADGETDLFGVMWKPADFDPERSYPVIAAVQPNQNISGAEFGYFRPGNVAQQLSQLGFIVIELRTRGQSRHVRDKSYILYSYNNERDFPLVDAKAVVEQMTARNNFMDINRVGVYGHSGGGFMAAALCMTYPSLFKVCVSSSGNHDNRIYEQSSTEYHWGVTQVEHGTEVDWVTNLHPNQELASGLDSKLLIIHGDNDKDVYFSHSVRLADALIKANKRFDFMIMPSKGHAYGDYNEYFDRLRWAYFAEHLIGDRRSFVDLKNPKANSN